MSHLDDYTNHGVKLAVPTLVGVQIQDVEDSLADLELRFEIKRFGILRPISNWDGDSTRSIASYGKVHELCETQ